MNPVKTTIPPKSLLHTARKEYDYTDSYRGILQDNNNQLTPGDAAKAFFSSGPQWVGKLFALRNKIASLFGLKTAGPAGDRQSQLENFKGEPGEQMGLFRVYERTEKEVILGEDDKHLDFRVSLFMEPCKTGSRQKELTITTTVVFNNWFGRLYFLPVRIFHKRIVPVMLKGIIKELEKRNL